MNPAGYSWSLHALPTIMQFASSPSDVVCFVIGINVSEPSPKSQVCEIYTAHSSMERTAGDICLKDSLGLYKEQTLNIK